MRLNDLVIDEKGNLAKVHDIDRNLRAVKIGRNNGKWRDFHALTIPTPEQLAQATIE